MSEFFGLGRLLAAIFWPLITEHSAARRKFRLAIGRVLTELDDDRRMRDVRMREFILARFDHVVDEAKTLREYLTKRKAKKIDAAIQRWIEIREDVAPPNETDFAVAADVIEVTEEEVGPGARPVDFSRRIQDRERRLKFNVRKVLSELISLAGGRPSARK